MLRFELVRSVSLTLVFGIGLAAQQPTEGEKLLKTDQIQLRADLAAHCSSDLLKGDRRLIEIDNEIRRVERTHEAIVKHNREHPESPQADDLEMLTELISLRKHVADIQDRYRRAIEGINARK